MNSVFSRSWAALVGAALLATLPVAAPAKPAAAVLPLDWTLSPARIASSCAASIATVKRRAGQIAATKSPRTFATVVLPLETAGADFNDDLAAQGFLYNVSTAAKVRAASLKCSTDSGNALSELSARPDLYRALAAARASGTARGLPQQKLQALWLTALARSGAALPDAKRRTFVALQQRLNDDQNKYGANLGNDQTIITITAAQAQSLPTDFVAAALKARPDGSYTVPVNESTVGPVLQNEPDPAARKAFYIAYANRGGMANVELLEDALTTRYRLAHLLGYPTWAAYVLADRMAQTPQRVESFLAQIDSVLLVKARQERDEDAALKGAPLDQRRCSRTGPGIRGSSSASARTSPRASRYQTT